MTLIVGIAIAGIRSGNQLSFSHTQVVKCIGVLDHFSILHANSSNLRADSGVRFLFFCREDSPVSSSAAKVFI